MRWPGCCSRDCRMWRGVETAVTDRDAGGSQAARVHSIDALNCRPDAPDYRLEVNVATSRDRGTVELAMLDTYSGTLVERWRWQGRLTGPERDYAGRDGSTAPASGELSAPWQSGDVALAAAALAREFACNLRPHTADVTTLHWPQDGELPEELADTVSASRHYVGAYRELSLAGPGADLSGDGAQPAVPGRCVAAVAGGLVGRPLPARRPGRHLYQRSAGEPGRLADHPGRKIGAGLQEPVCGAATTGPRRSGRLPLPAGRPAWCDPGPNGGRAPTSVCACACATWGRGRWPMRSSHPADISRAVSVRVNIIVTTPGDASAAYCSPGRFG